ncbi:phage tail protein [Patulibacter americanus]|uniref:phage tail protein n=1 Tax=Patulibacter americanus TaxID=588672 RepID=UPI0003B44CFD|nr:tail fiber protein [Patulibacter americanus]
MADPFVAEIRPFPFTFAPKGWAFCDGQLMPISQNTALFSLLGTAYGGDGKSTFALPNLKGRAPIGTGQGNGLSNYTLGQESGSAQVILLEAEMPQHTHVLQASSDPAELQTPGPDRALARAAPGRPYGTDPNADRVWMAAGTLAPVGSTEGHNNMPPVLAINYCIALQGVFPQRQ